MIKNLKTSDIKPMDIFCNKGFYEKSQKEEMVRF
jgi:hypothetical protein